MSEVQSKVVEIIVDKLGVKESEVVPEADEFLIKNYDAKGELSQNLADK